MTPNSLLVTIDVNSQYTDIPHSDGVEACRPFLTINTTDQSLVNDIPTLVDFILKHDLFVFDDKQYLQINGTAMRNKCHQHTPILLSITLKIYLFLLLICNQVRIYIYIIIHKFKTHSKGVDQDLLFLSSHSYLYLC